MLLFLLQANFKLSFHCSSEMSLPMSFIKHFPQLSDTMKLAIGFASLLLIAAIGITTAFSTIVPSNDTLINNDQPATSGELYAQELLLHEVAQLPADAVAIEESPGEPPRYYLLRSYLESQDVEDTSNIAALHYPYEEDEQ